MFSSGSSSSSSDSGSFSVSGRCVTLPSDFPLHGHLHVTLLRVDLSFGNARCMDFLDHMFASFVHTSGGMLSLVAASMSVAMSLITWSLMACAVSSGQFAFKCPGVSVSALHRGHLLSSCFPRAFM